MVSLSMKPRGVSIGGRSPSQKPSKVTLFTTIFYNSESSICYLNPFCRRFLQKILVRFYRKRGRGPDQSHYNQSRLWSRLHTTPTQITRLIPKSIYTQNRRQKVVNMGLHVCAGGLYVHARVLTFKFNKNSTSL